jgi:hypothetical protein
VTGPTGSSSTSVYGTLYGSNVVFNFVVAGTVEFTGSGPISGMTADLSNNALTIVTTGVYAVNFSVLVEASDTPADTFVSYTINVNGTDLYNSELLFYNNNPDVLSLNGSKTILLALNASDTVSVTVAGDITNHRYMIPMLIVNKIG